MDMRNNRKEEQPRQQRILVHRNQQTSPNWCPRRQHKAAANGKISTRVEDRHCFIGGKRATNESPVL